MTVRNHIIVPAHRYIYAKKAVSNHWNTALELLFSLFVVAGIIWLVK